MKSIVVIPARMGSSRFPGKPLVDLNGKPMIQWVYERSCRNTLTDHVLIATPDEAIREVAQGFGAEVVMTGDHHQTGTDRIAEVAEKVVADIYINVQGDEPLVSPKAIEDCGRALIETPDAGMSTIMDDCPHDIIESNATIKVVVDQNGYALYFSRFPVPFARNPRVKPVLRNMGLYAFRREVLLQYGEWPISNLERAESIEQLRFLENGVRIKLVFSEGSPLAVDEPRHADEIRRLLMEDANLL